MPSIFISYRRADSRTHAGRIHDRLATEFGDDSVFKDVDDIPDGAVFPELLDEALKRTDVLLAIIGPRWLDAVDKRGNRRLDNPKDFTRQEIEAALGRESCVVIPLLVDGASMPDREDLPESLHGLLNRNARPIRDDPDFHADMYRLIQRLRKLDGKLALERAAAELQPPPIEAPPSVPESAKHPPPSEQATVPAVAPRRRRLWISVVLLLTFAAALLFGLNNMVNRDVPTRTETPRNTLDAGTDAADVDADAIAQEFRDAFNAIVAEFGHGDCIGFTPDEEFAFGANWIFSFSDEGLIDDIPISHDSAISPDGTMGAVSNDALYRFGEDTVRMFGIGGAPKFSADSRYLASDRIGIKEIASGRLVRNGRGVEQYSAISPDGRYAVLRATREENAAVIDVQADQRIIEDDGGNGFAEARFSPIGRLLAIAGIGVYDLSSRQLIIDSKETGITFSPDERIIAGGQAIADTTTGETVLELDSSVPAFFTLDSRYMALQGVGVYDLTSMTRLFDLGDTGVAVSHNGQYVASQLTGWFRLPDGERFPIDDPADDDYYYAPPLFSADDQFVAFDGDGIYSIESGRKVLDYPHDFVAFAPGRRLILVELEDEGCALIGDSGAYSNSQPLPVE